MKNDKCDTEGYLPLRLLMLKSLERLISSEQRVPIPNDGHNKSPKVDG
jgi:hypothetical protein